MNVPVYCRQKYLFVKHSKSDFPGSKRKAHKICKFNTLLLTALLGLGLVLALCGLAFDLLSCGVDEDGFAFVVTLNLK